MSIPSEPSLAWISTILFLIGLFLFISGLNIIRIEKLFVTHGVKTWSIGLLLMIASVLIFTPRFIPEIKAFYTLISISSIEGIYKRSDNANVFVKKTGKESYKITSDHSKVPGEKGHEWVSFGFLKKSIYFGIFKYPEESEKYRGYTGIHEIKIDGDCLVLNGTKYIEDNFSFSGRVFGPHRYCK